MAEKASKALVNYRLGTVSRRCELCTMFRPPSSCTAVEGRISPIDLCDYFKRQPSNVVAFGSLGGSRYPKAS